MLPIDSRLIHWRRSGESTWIPYGEFRPGIEFENHTSHPAPGMLAMYPGGISEREIFLVRDGAFVGDRGYGRLIKREGAGD